MKGILIYQPTSKSAPLADFIDGLDPRLREKILLRLYFLTQLEKPEMKEPHFKRFSIERYRDLWELRVKSKVLIRIIFCTLPNGDVLLLHGFVKRQKRGVMAFSRRHARLFCAADSPTRFAAACCLFRVSCRWCSCRFRFSTTITGVRPQQTAACRQRHAP